MTDHIADAGKKVIDLDALEKLADEVLESQKGTDLQRMADADQAFYMLSDPATIKALIAELKGARGVIKPLADCEIIEPDQPLADDITARYLFSMGEIRAARAFLALNGNGEG